MPMIFRPGPARGDVGERSPSHWRFLHGRLSQIQNEICLLSGHSIFPESVSCDGQILGTPAYMSPEQAFGKRDEVGPRSDVYSLGATLYALLAGKGPFSGRNVLETLRQLHDLEPEPLRRLNPSVPRDLEAICLKAMDERQKTGILPPVKWPTT